MRPFSRFSLPTGFFSLWLLAAPALAQQTTPKANPAAKATPAAISPAKPATGAATKPSTPTTKAASPTGKTNTTPTPAAKTGYSSSAPTTKASPAPATASKSTAAPAKPRPPLPQYMGSSDPNMRYQNGKTLIDQGRYDLAMQELQPITAPAAQFVRGPEAAYLYAVAASRAKKWAEAEQMLNLVRNEYSKWPGLSEALFLQAQVSFEQSEPDNALRVLSQIPAGQLEVERAAIKATYLPQVKDKALFQTLIQTYPQDATLARTYAGKLVTDGWYTDADKSQLNQLITQFNLDKTRYTPQPKAAKKSSYNVGVLLPFEFADTSWETRRKNQFVTDLYAGLRLAQDSLQREGHPVQLFAYDTGADTLQLKQVLALPELASMDLIIGPIYKSGSKLLARYAQQHQIICINPLSQDGDLVLDNGWHYLFEPSNTTQAKQTAQFALNNFPNRTAVVLHDNTKDETTFAQAYKTAYEALGGKVQVLRRLDTSSDEALAASLADLDLRTTGHVVVASDERKLGQYLFKHIQTQAVRTPIIAPAAWIENPRVSLGQLNNREVYFLHPKYLDRTALGVRRFRQLYMQQQHLPPSVFAFTGFELLYYFGQQLHQYGAAFQQNLASSGPVSGSVFQGIGYPAGAHDNQYVPFTKLNHLELEVLNPVGLR